MKTYEEMAQSALARGKAIRKERKKTHKIMFGALSGLVACCLVILFAFGIGETGPNQNPTKLMKTNPHAVNPCADLLFEIHLK